MIIVIFFMIFQLLEIEKKIIIMKKKNFWCRTDGLLPNYIVKKKRKNFVLQYRNCIERNKGEGCGIVLQPVDCIAIEEGWKQGAVYCNTLHCIAT